MRVHPGNLPRQQHGGVAGRIEAECDLFQREGRVRDRETDLAGEQQIEAAGARVAVHGGHQRSAEIEAGQQRRGDVAQALHRLLVDALAAREALRDRNRRLHIHAGAFQF